MHKTVTIHPILGLISISQTLPAYFFHFFFFCCCCCCCSNVIFIQFHFLSHLSGRSFSFLLAFSFGLLLSFFRHIPVFPTNAIVMLLRSLTDSLSLSSFLSLSTFARLLIRFICIYLYVCWYCTCSRILKFLIHDQDFYNLYVFVFVSMIWILNRFRLHEI